MRCVGLASLPYCVEANWKQRQLLGAEVLLSSNSACGPHQDPLCARFVWLIYQKKIQ